MSYLERQDPEIYAAIENERRRQVEVIALIPSENYTSAAVLEASGSVLTNKYAEGYPGARYYGGCEWVDVAESLAIERAKSLFGAAHANVQPHAGAQANLAAYAAVLNPGDTVLGMALPQGGHLTHGSPVNFSAKLYNFVPYHVRKEDELLDYDEILRLAKEHKPKLIVAGATAYSRFFDFPRLRQIADETGALLMVDMAHFAGLVAGGAHPNPVPHAQIVTTTTHKTLRGPRGGMILCEEKFQKAVDRAVFPYAQGGPLMHTIAAKAVALKEAATPEFADYSRRICLNAKALAASLSTEGLRIVSGGTDNHLMLVDVRPLDMTGKVAEKALDEVGIIVNMNTIPYDPQKANVTSGIRLGTPATTTRGMGEPEMARIGTLIARALRAKGDQSALRAVAAEVLDLTKRYPVPGITAEDRAPLTTPGQLHVSGHPLIREKLTRLRDERTGPADFRALVAEIATLLLYEATADLALAVRDVRTPVAPYRGARLAEKIGLVPVLRAGIGMVEAALDLMPEAEVWHIGLFRDERTLEPIEYYNRLPGAATVQVCLVLDPMLATGGSAVATIDILKRWGAMRVKFVGIIAAPEGVEALSQAHPDVPMHIAALDEYLNEKGFIVPASAMPATANSGTG